jgi:hypothetical protein
VKEIGHSDINLTGKPAAIQGEIQELWQERQVDLNKKKDITCSWK